MLLKTFALFIFGIVYGLSFIPTLNCTKVYARLTSEDKVFESIFLGENADVLSVFPSCLLLSASGNVKDVLISSVNWTEAHYEKILRQRKISALNVSLAMSIFQLLDVNERDRTVKIAVQTVTRWSDCRLSWSQSEFSHVSNITIPPSRFRSLGLFVPDVILLEQTEPFAAQASETEIRVTSLGNILIDRLYTTTVSCTLDVEMYPFDSHSCNFTFETLFNSLELNLEYPEDEEDSIEDISKHLLGNGRYVLSDTFELVFLPPIKSRRWVCSQLDYVGQNELDYLHCFTDRLTYRLLLRRHPRYYIIHLFIPAFLCLLCSATVFIITPGFMDKVFPSTFTMVSMLMFITSTYAEMPETGYTLSWMSLYYFACIFIVSLNCIYSSVSSTMAVIKLPVPPSLQVIVQFCSSVVLFDIVPHRKKKSVDPADGTNAEMISMSNNNCEAEDQDSSTTVEKSTEITWRHVVACFDRFYFAFVLPFSVATLVYFIAVGLNTENNAFYRYALLENDWLYINEQLKMHFD